MIWEGLENKPIQEIPMKDSKRKENSNGLSGPWRPSILVVDDEVEVCNILYEFLGRDYNVETEVSGEKALKRIEKGGLDLIITDLKLNSVSGMDILRKAKDKYQFLEVIVITGHATDSSVMEALSCGACSYLQKPMTFAEVDVRVKEALAKRDFSLKTRNLLDKIPESDVELRKHVQHLVDLHDLVRKLVSTIDYEDVVDAILRGLNNAIGSECCSLLIKDNSGVAIYLYSRSVLDSDAVEAIKSGMLSYWESMGNELPGDDLVKLALRTGSYITSSGSAEAIRSNAIIPLVIQTRVMGLLGAHDRGTNAIPKEKELILYLMSGQIASVLDNASLHQHTRLLASTDGLTGLLNYRSFQERLQHEFERSRRYGSNLSLILVDIDNFKQVNDSYGHQQGDIVLRGIATILKRWSREVDILARYGGEEFVMILPETNLENAYQVAERIRREAEGHIFELPNAKVKVTVSLGVASYPHHGITSKDMLIEGADDAMYRAKKMGKNKVCLMD